MNYSDDDNQEELIELYTSKEAVSEAAREKEASEKVFEDIGVQLKDFPGPQREIDLHGFTGSEAMFELSNFLDRAINQRVRTVRVITGKGLHSQHMKSVLPELTERKLGEFRRAGTVLAFRREKNGGAFLVYLVS
ncbi:Smr/MutS family protein [Candidatus Peregrinibacteria bacterium]|nr:Smr/MutS family protein [Candidatus Peregrinibacteria bacterium]